MSAAREARERLGIAAVMSPDHAAGLLMAIFPTRAEARGWLSEQGLVREVPGRPGRWCVVWRAVIDRLDEGDSMRPTTSGGLRRGSAAR